MRKSTDKGGVETIEPLPIGRYLARLRDQRQWTKARLARRLGVSESYVSQLESGQRQPRLATLRNVAATFGMPAWLFLLAVEDPGVVDRLPEDLRLLVL